MKTRIIAIAAAVVALSSQGAFADSMMSKDHKMAGHSTMMGGKHPAMGMKMSHGKMMHSKMMHGKMSHGKMMHDKMMGGKMSHDKMGNDKMMHGKMGHM